MSPRICLKVYVLCANMAKIFQKKKSQIADEKLQCAMLQSGLTVNLNHLQYKSIFNYFLG